MRPIYSVCNFHIELLDCTQGLQCDHLYREFDVIVRNRLCE